MTNPSDISQVARRDQLLEQIQDILHPQLIESPSITVEQQKQLLAAIANYEIDSLRDFTARINRLSPSQTADML